MITIDQMHQYASELSGKYLPRFKDTDILSEIESLGIQDLLILLADAREAFDNKTFPNVSRKAIQKKHPDALQFQQTLSQVSALIQKAVVASDTLWFAMEMVNNIPYVAEQSIYVFTEEEYAKNWHQQIKGEIHDVITLTQIKAPKIVELLTSCAYRRGVLNCQINALTYKSTPIRCSMIVPRPAELSNNDESAITNPQLFQAIANLQLLRFADADDDALDNAENRMIQAFASSKLIIPIQEGTEIADEQIPETSFELSDGTDLACNPVFTDRAEYNAEYPNASYDLKAIEFNDLVNLPQDNIIVNPDTLAFLMDIDMVEQIRDINQQIIQEREKARAQANARNEQRSNQNQQQGKNQQTNQNQQNKQQNQKSTNQNPARNNKNAGNQNRQNAQQQTNQAQNNQNNRQNAQNPATGKQPAQNKAVVNNKPKTEPEKPFMPSLTADQELRKQALGGLKVPHSSSQPLIHIKDGTAYLVIYTFFYTKDDLINNEVPRPTYVLFADITTGEVLHEYKTPNEFEFSDAPYDKKYSLNTEKKFNKSKDHYAKAYDILDEIRKDYVKTGQIDKDKYKEYLERILQNIPEEHVKFYRQLSNCLGPYGDIYNPMEYCDLPVDAIPKVKQDPIEETPEIKETLATPEETEPEDIQKTPDESVNKQTKGDNQEENDTPDQDSQEISNKPEPEEPEDEDEDEEDDTPAQKSERSTKSSPKPVIQDEKDDEDEDDEENKDVDDGKDVDDDDEDNENEDEDDKEPAQEVARTKTTDSTSKTPVPVKPQDKSDDEDDNDNEDEEDDTENKDQNNDKAGEDIKKSDDTVKADEEGVKPQTLPTKTVKVQKTSEKPETDKPEKPAPTSKTPVQEAPKTSKAVSTPTEKPQKQAETPAPKQKSPVQKPAPIPVATPASTPAPKTASPAEQTKSGTEKPIPKDSKGSEGVNRAVALTIKTIQTKAKRSDPAYLRGGIRHILRPDGFAAKLSEDERTRAIALALEYFGLKDM